MPHCICMRNIFELVLSYLFFMFGHTGMNFITRSDNIECKQNHKKQISAFLLYESVALGFADDLLLMSHTSHASQD